MLYAAYFTKNLELADHAVLLDAAGEAGLDRGEASKVLLSGRFSDEVRRDEAAAARMGVHGVPYFVINGKLAIPDAMSKNDFAAALPGKRNRKRMSAVLTDADLNKEARHGCESRRAGPQFAIITDTLN